MQVLIERKLSLDCGHIQTKDLKGLKKIEESYTMQVLSKLQKSHFYSSQFSLEVRAFHNQSKLLAQKKITCLRN